MYPIRPLSAGVMAVEQVSEPTKFQKISTSRFPSSFFFFSGSFVSGQFRSSFFLPFVCSFVGLFHMSPKLIASLWSWLKRQRWRRHLYYSSISSLVNHKQQQQQKQDWLEQCDGREYQIDRKSLLEERKTYKNINIHCVPCQNIS